MINDFGDLRRILELAQASNYTILCKAMKWLMKNDVLDRLIKEILTVVIETVNPMIKRNLDSALRARSYWAWCREMVFRLFTHDVAIV